MTSEQVFHSIADNVLASYREPKAQRGCPMHPKKISQKCRKCQLMKTQGPSAHSSRDYSLSESFPQVIRLSSNPKGLMGARLQTIVQSCPRYKREYKTCNSVKEVLSLLTAEEMALTIVLDNGPTDYMMVLYRLCELRPTREQLVIMLRSNNVNVRCVALLYVRMFVVPEDIYACVKGSLNDNKLVCAEMTVGEYVLQLMDQQQLNHYELRLPRIPLKILTAIEAQICRRRERSNSNRSHSHSNSSSPHSQSHHQSGRRKIKNKQYTHQEYLAKKQKKYQEMQQKQIKIQSQKQKTQQIHKQTQKISLKEKIRRLQAQNANKERRSRLLSKYEPQNEMNLQQREQQRRDSDSEQKYELG